MPPSDRRPLFKSLLIWAWLLGLQLGLYAEIVELTEHFSHGSPQNWDLATRVRFWSAYLLAPACYLFHSHLDYVAKAKKRHHTLFLGLVVVLVGAAWLSSSYVACFESPHAPVSLADCSPIVHDEFSYLLQAKGFAKGTWSFAGPPELPELFHQMHIMNEGRVASRYLPGVGAWLTVFTLLGLPHLANRVAFVLITLMAACIGHQIRGRWAAAVCGILVATCPGLAVFSNLLLSHLPCLVGLGTFLCAMPAVDSSQPNSKQAMIAAVGLSFAMLCRPLTAAAVGLPFGLSLGCRMLSARRNGQSQGWVSVILTMAAPLMLGFIIVGWQAKAVCGSPFKAPYFEYTQLYTPRHAFGFGNGQKKPDEPKLVLKEYNEWAKDLDGPLAIANAEQRLRECVNWTLGTPALIFGSLLFLLGLKRHNRFVWLLFASSLSLHIAHIPYWLTGILGYHYVFESSYIWLILVGYAVGDLGVFAVEERRPLVPVWLAVMWLAISHSNYFDSATGSPCRIAQGVSSLTANQERYEQFQAVLESSPPELPAIVLVRKSEGDLHLEYCRNAPDFNRPLLVGTWRPDLYTAAEIQAAYPTRSLYLYSSDSQELRRVDN